MGEREGLGCSECFLLFRGGTLELQLLCNLTGKELNKGSDDLGGDLSSPALADNVCGTSVG